ncbi:hypothetical protein K492DRAFT_174070 [Lichtheimia hyalospora FSU 10163]|nr:hypothetical protein K492DRAFT_174070 [Lichtheimia hyalospora FSU 10163]
MKLSHKIQRYMETVLIALDARASLLIKFNDLNAALNDALTMITLAPWSVTGYLAADRIYSLQGAHTSVLEIYEQMLQNVPDVDQQHYKFHNRATKKKKRNRVDFMTELPLDVVLSYLVPKILNAQPMLEIGKQRSYFNVCRNWRQRIAMADGLRFHIGPDRLPRNGYDQLSDIAPYIQWLSVSHEEHENLLKIPQSTSYMSLQRLDITESVTRSSGHLLLALQNWSDTLEQLSIGYERNRLPKHLYRLCDILDACANLTSLSILCKDTYLPDASTQYPKITNLDLRTTQYKFNKNSTTSLLKSFPHLRSLRLRPSPGSDIFPLIEQYCPWLQHLFLDCVCLHLPDPPKAQRKGIRILCVAQGIGHAEVKGDDLVRFLMQHADTLETFITGRDGLDLSEGVLDQVTTFCRLLHMRVGVHLFSDSLNLLLTWMIRHAPYLETLGSLWSTYKYPILPELQTRHCLKHIGVRVPGAPDDYMETFIQHHLALGDQSNLQKITIHFYIYRVWNNWFSLVLQLTQLKSVDLFFDYRIIAEYAMPFIIKLAETVEQLTLACDEPSLDYNFICQIPIHPNMKHLVIDAQALEGDVSSDIVNHFEGLISLHLRLYSFNWNDMDVLRKGTYELTCETRKYRRFSG